MASAQKQAPTVSHLLLDFGNVVAGFDHLTACRRLVAHTRLDEDEIHQRIFGTDLEPAFDRGELDGDEFYERVVTTVDARNLTFERFAEIWSDIYFANTAIDAVLREVVGTLYLLSNTNELHWPRVRKMAVLRHFADRCILSFEVGARKPDPAIFEAALRRMQTAPERVLFVDDLTANLDPARKLGMHVLHYDCRRHDAAVLVDCLRRHRLLA